MPDTSSPSPRRDLHEANRAAWNAATPALESHKRAPADFFRAGGSTLFPEEVALLGDLRGRTLVHLQCNAGHDTMSLARLGARVTGVDISDTAVDLARRVAAEAGIEATFERDDVLDWLPAAAAEGRRFDVAFVSYGALCWLSDLRAWAAGVAGVLAPGGRFCIVEFHPVGMMFDEEMRLAHPYASGGGAHRWDDGVTDYVAAAGDALTPMGWDEGVRDFVNPNPAYEFTWSVGDVVTALLDAGLALEAFREFPYSNGFAPYKGMRPVAGNRWLPPAGVPDLPLMYALAARRPG